MDIQSRFIRLPQVRTITGLSTSTIYRMMRRGEFPKQIALGSNIVAWTTKAVEEWCDKRIASIA